MIRRCYAAGALLLACVATSLLAGCGLADCATPATDAADAGDARAGASDAAAPVRCDEPEAWSWMNDVGKPDRGGGVPVWADDEMLAYAPRWPDSGGAIYDPALDVWRPMALEGTPPINSPAAAVWTGLELLLWSGQWSTGFEDCYQEQTGGRYDPATDTWSPMSIDGAPAERLWTSAVWTGAEMLVWGGLASPEGGCGFVYFGDGGRYDPALDAWQPLPSAGAPSARMGSSTVWTGEEMLVWGGQGEDPATGSGVAFGDGAAFDPATDTWRPLATAGALPADRYGFTTVWTGSEWIFWGGQTWPDTVSAGAAYDPVADQWRATSTAGAPAPRTNAGAAWTGDEMIIFGGRTRDETNDDWVWFADGGRYDPYADAWTPIAWCEPTRAGYSAFWTGTKMILYEGDNETPNWLRSRLYTP